MFLTKRRRWTEAEQSMMRAAARRQARRIATYMALVALACSLLLIGALQGARWRAETLAESVLTARADGVEYALDNLRPFARWAMGRLRQHFDDPSADPVSRLRAAYALAEFGIPPRTFLVGAIPIAPAAECRNLFSALACIDENILPELSALADSAAEAAHRARFAIVALHMGDHLPAQDLLASRDDPSLRTALIHTYATWHDDLSAVAELPLVYDDPAFRSGLAAAWGMIAPETLASPEREAVAATLAELFRDSPDSATHAAAGWALRQWKREPPAVASTARAPAGRRWFVNGQRMTMVEVAPGTFTMGRAGAFGNDFDKSAHEVALTSAFYLADREVTVEQFRRCVDDRPYPDSEKPQEWRAKFENYAKFSPTADCPVTSVKWSDALLYCNWLSVREGRRPCYVRTGERKAVSVDEKEFYIDGWRCDFSADGYRLPTEAEWEYAARAGSALDYDYGDDEELLTQYAWFIINGKSRSWPGGAKLPNAWGLFDMHGNVWEWCWDWIDRYGAGAATDPVGPSEPGAVVGRVARGGSYNHSGTDCRAANRYGYFPEFTSIFYGFRVCCTGDAH
jgi:formylglycine-generating enzyme required for sulfatase activity